MKQETEAILTDIRNALLMSGKDVLTVKECALLIGYTENTVRNLCMRREIPHYHSFGRRIFFDKKEVTQWLKFKKIPVRTPENGRAQ